MNIFRIITVFFMQSFMVFICIVLVFSLLKERRTRTKIIFACYYIFISIGFVINWVYYFIFEESVVIVLYYIAIICVYGSGIFMVVFSLTLWKGEEKISLLTQLLIIVLFYAILTGLTFIIDGVTINENTNWEPIWNIEITILYIFMMIFSIILPTSYFILKKIKSINPIEKNVKKGWTVFLIGILLYCFGVIIFLFVRIFTPKIFIVIQMITVLIEVIGAFVLYFGLRHEFK